MHHLDYVATLSDQQVNKLLKKSCINKTCVRCEKECNNYHTRIYCYGLTGNNSYSCDNQECTIFLQYLQARQYYAVLAENPINLNICNDDNNKSCIFTQNGKWVLDAMRFNTCDSDSLTFYYYHNNPFAFDYIMIDKITENMFDDILPTFDTSMFSDHQWKKLRKSVLKNDLCSKDLFDKLCRTKETI